MSVEGNRICRIAACCLLAVFAMSSMPARVMAAEFDTYYDAEPPEPGILCTDQMIEDPYTDELEPTPVAHADAGCTVPDLPIST